MASCFLVDKKLSIELSFVNGIILQLLLAVNYLIFSQEAQKKYKLSHDLIF